MRQLDSIKWINDQIKECQCDSTFLSDFSSVQSDITRIIRSCDLDIVEKVCHQFDRGYTSVWLLQQSHVSIHSWPEYNFLTLNIEVCNFAGDDPSKIDKLHTALVDFYKPKHSKPGKFSMTVQ